MTNQQVGAWVKARREARKISVKRAHEKAGISRQTWYDLENGAHPPSFETQAGVAKALGGESGDMLHDASNPMSRQSRVYRRVDRVDPHDSDNAKHLIRTHVTILPCLHTAGVVGSSPISPTTNPLVRRPGGFVCPVTRLGLAPIRASLYGGRMSRELLFRVTRADFDESHIRGSGAGGQHRNKVATGVRLVHRASGAVGEAVDDKSQTRNRAEAFKRLRQTDEWKRWYRDMVATTMGRPSIEQRVEAAMNERNITTQILDDRSRWVTVDPAELDRPPAPPRREMNA